MLTDKENISNLELDYVFNQITDIEEIRKLSGLSILDMSVKMNTGIGNVQNLENGKRNNPTISTIANYLESCGYELLFAIKKK